MENKKIRIFLFVDGTNMYAGQYDLFGPKKYLDFNLLIKEFHNKKKIFLMFLENKIMYHGMFYFKTYILILKNKPIFKRVFKNLILLKIITENVIKNV